MLPWKTRFVTINPTPGSQAQVRVNIAYERELTAAASAATTTTTRRRSSTRVPTPPPVLSIEGFHDERQQPPMEMEKKFIIPITGSNGEEEPRVVRLLKRRSNGSAAGATQTKRVYRLPPAPPDVWDTPPEPQLVKTEEQPQYENGYIDNYEQLQPECSQENGKTSRMLVECRLCGEAVTSQLRKQHVYMRHLKKKLFRCPFCETAHNYHKGNVEQHIRKAHNSRAKAISQKEEFNTEVDVWMYRCFSDRRMFRCIDTDVVDTVEKLVEWTCSGLSHPPRQSTENSNDGYFDDQFPEVILENESVDEVVVPASPQPPKIVNNPVIPSPSRPRGNLTCKLCGMANLRHLERHVLQYHLKRAIYLCPFCDYSSNYAMNAVKDHLKTKHIVTNQEAIDLRSEHWSEIRRLWDACFLPENARRPPSPVFYPVWQEKERTF